MDGESFDRLSVVVHRLRDQATRRGALGLLLGGAVAAMSGLASEETEARKHKHKKRNKHKGCKGFGGRCNGSRDCCNGRCRNGFCFPGNGGGGGGNRCNGVRCPNGWRCCRFQGIDRCLPSDDVRCNGGECPFNWDRCGFNGPVRTCCSPDTHCCENQFGNLICLNDMFDCDDFFDTDRQSAKSSTTSNGDDAVSDPIPVTDIDPEEFS